MNEIDLFIKYLPILLSNIVYGVIFITVYRFIRFGKQDKNLKLTFVKYLTANFFIKSFADLLMNDSLEIMYIIFSFFISVVLAVLFGKLVSSKMFNKALLKIGINRTTNENIWDDLISDNTYLNVQMKTNSESYLGMVKYIEESNNKPSIALCNYKCFDINTAELLQDYTDQPERIIVLSGDDIDKVEIISAK